MCGRMSEDRSVMTSDENSSCRHCWSPRTRCVSRDPVRAPLYAAFKSRATYSCRHFDPCRVRIFSRFNWSAIFRSDLPVFLSR